MIKRRRFRYDEEHDADETNDNNIRFTTLVMIMVAQETMGSLFMIAVSEIASNCNLGASHFARRTLFTQASLLLRAQEDRTTCSQITLEHCAIDTTTILIISANAITMTTTGLWFASRFVCWLRPESSKGPRPRMGQQAV